MPEQCELLANIGEAEAGSFAMMIDEKCIEWSSTNTSQAFGAFL